ncbi:hypothetical protein C8R44DRAFT_752544 [Mycena epipterygia]|nr:hypothetical protein C8R44DRAFT_752544 [Mycena epipterygia]
MFDGRIAKDNFVLTYGSVFKLTRTHYQHSDKVIDSQENRWQYLGDLGWKLYLIWLQAKLKNYAQNNFVLIYGSVFKLTRTHYQHSDKVIDSQENRWQYLGDLGWKLYLIWLQAKLKNYAQNNFVLTYGSVFKLTRTHYQHSDKANFGTLPLSSALPLAQSLYAAADQPMLLRFGLCHAKVCFMQTATLSVISGSAIPYVLGKGSMPSQLFFYTPNKTHFWVLVFFKKVTGYRCSGIINKCARFTAMSAEQHWHVLRRLPRCSGYMVLAGVTSLVPSVIRTYSIWKAHLTLVIASAMVYAQNDNGVCTERQWCMHRTTIELLRLYTFCAILLCS